jgi:hypothetical protein
MLVKGFLGRCLVALGFSVTLLFLAAGPAFGYSATISNGFYRDPSGVFAPRHSLTKVDVERTSTAGDWACEDALNNDGTWAQVIAYCASSSGEYVYHLFCGCQLRYGWNGPRSSAGAWMIGFEFY